MIGSLWLAPILADISPFSKISWIANSKDGVTIINKTERVFVSENKAFVEGLNKLRPSMVGVRAYLGNRLATEGNGFILTSDGLIVTSSLLVPNKSSIKIIFNNGEVSKASILKKDEKSGLALLKTEQENLTPVALAELDLLQPAQSLFLSFLNINDSSSPVLVNRGYIRQIENDKIDARFYSESGVATGAAVIDEQGGVVGLATVDSSGSISLIDSSKIVNILSK